MVLLLTAFRLAWPAFAYSIEDDARRGAPTRSCSRTSLFITCWVVARRSALLAPWIVRILAARAARSTRGARVVGLLAFSRRAWGAYTVVAIGIGRARAHAVQLGRLRAAAAVINVALCFALHSPVRDDRRRDRDGRLDGGAMFGLMAIHAQRVYPVPYQWRRALRSWAAPRSRSQRSGGRSTCPWRRLSFSMLALPAHPASARLLPPCGAAATAGCGVALVAAAR